MTLGTILPFNTQAEDNPRQPT